MNTQPEHTQTIHATKLAQTVEKKDRMKPDSEADEAFLILQILTLAKN